MLLFFLFSLWCSFDICFASTSKKKKRERAVNNPRKRNSPVIITATAILTKICSEDTVWNHRNHFSLQYDGLLFFFFLVCSLCIFFWFNSSVEALVRFYRNEMMPVSPCPNDGNALDSHVFFILTFPAFVFFFFLVFFSFLVFFCFSFLFCFSSCFHVVCVRGVYSFRSPCNLFSLFDSVFVSFRFALNERMEGKQQQKTAAAPYDLSHRTLIRDLLRTIDVEPPPIISSFTMTDYAVFYLSFLVSFLSVGKKSLLCSSSLWFCSPREPHGPCPPPTHPTWPLDTIIFFYVTAFIHSPFPI